MATIQFSANKNISPSNEVIVATWPTLTFSGTDVGAALCLAEFADKTFQVTGTLGAAGAVLIEGSNDGVTWAALSNRQGTAMSFTALGINTSQDKPAYVRPRITAGDGTTSLTVSVACHKSDIGVAGGAEEHSMINTNGVIVQNPKFFAAFDNGDTVLFPFAGPEGFTDSSATPGAATHPTWRGRASIAAAGTSVVITNANITANSTILAIVSSVDGTAKTCVAVPAAGSVTITLNAAATGTTKVDYVVIGK